MTEFVRAHAAVNEWVYSNVISDNQFWYLTDGRLSLAEGSALYQIYDLQRRAAERLARWREFAHTAQPSLLAPYRVHYVVLYRQRACASAACTDYGFNVLPAEFSAFESNPAYALAYSNSSFLVFELNPTSR